MILAIDCDLRQSYGVTDGGWAERRSDPADVVRACPYRIDTLLFEIASPVSFNRGGQSSAIMYNLAKWAIWNVAKAAQLDGYTDTRETYTFLVCPSNIWTRGYDLKTRHLIAKCVQPKKDLREAECMLFMYKQDPTPWLPLHEYLSRI